MQYSTYNMDNRLLVVADDDDMYWIEKGTPQPLNYRCQMDVDGGVGGSEEGRIFNRTLTAILYQPLHPHPGELF